MIKLFCDRRWMDNKHTSLITGAAVDAFSCRLDDDVDLMRRAPHMQHIELGATRVASDDTRVAPSHCVLAVRRRVEQLDALVWVERVIKLDEQVVDDLRFLVV